MGFYLKTETEWIKKRKFIKKKKNESFLTDDLGVEMLKTINKKKTVKWTKKKKKKKSQKRILESHMGFQ